MALGVLGASRSQVAAQGGELRPAGAVHLNPVFVPATALSVTQGRPCVLKIERLPWSEFMCVLCH